MNQRKLIKELGYKSTMKVRDYYSSSIDEDMPGFLTLINEYCEAEYGDIVCIITLKSPKLKRKRDIFKNLNNK